MKDNNNNPQPKPLYRSIDGYGSSIEGVYRSIDIYIYIQVDTFFSQTMICLSSPAENTLLTSATIALTPSVCPTYFVSGTGAYLYYIVIIIIIIRSHLFVWYVDLLYQEERKTKLRKLTEVRQENAQLKEELKLLADNNPLLIEAMSTY